MSAEFCARECVRERGCQYLPTNMKQKCYQGCITSCRPKPADVAEALVDNALMSLAGAPDTSGAIMPYADRSIVPYTPPEPTGTSLSEAMQGLSGLLATASGLGSAFISMYDTVTGSSFLNDVSQFFATPPTPGNGSTTTSTFVACERLAEDIRKALAALHTTTTLNLPYTCSNGARTACSETFINTTRDKIKTLDDEIAGLNCQIQGKRFDYKILEYTLRSCTEQLEVMNLDCTTTPVCTTT